MKIKIRMLGSMQKRIENFHTIDIVEYITSNSEIPNSYIMEKIQYEQAINFDHSFGNVSVAILSDHFLNKQKDEKKYSFDTLTYYWRIPTSLSSHRSYEQPLRGCQYWIGSCLYVYLDIQCNCLCRCHYSHNKKEKK